jgi:hypothetical protein
MRGCDSQHNFLIGISIKSLDLLLITLFQSFSKQNQQFQCLMVQIPIWLTFCVIYYILPKYRMILLQEAWSTPLCRQQRARRRNPGRLDIGKWVVEMASQWILGPGGDYVLGDFYQMGYFPYWMMYVLIWLDLLVAVSFSKSLVLQDVLEAPPKTCFGNNGNIYSL